VGQTETLDLIKVAVCFSDVLNLLKTVKINPSSSVVLSLSDRFLTCKQMMVNAPERQRLIGCCSSTLQSSKTIKGNTFIYIMVFIYWLSLSLQRDADELLTILRCDWLRGGVTWTSTFDNNNIFKSYIYKKLLSMMFPWKPTCFNREAKSRPSTSCPRDLISEK